MASRRRKNRKRKKPGIEEVVKDLNQDTPPSETVADKAPDVVAVEDQSSAKDSPSETEANTTHSDRVIEALNNVEQLLTQVNQPSQQDSSDAPEWLETLNDSLEKSHDKIVSQLNRVTQSFEQQLEELRKSFADRPGNATENSSSKAIIAVSNDKVIEKTSPDSKEPENDWEQRKRAMYAEYGEAVPDEGDKEISSENSHEDQDELASLQESLHDSIESLDGVQAEEIEDLRAQLTEKLREAEVELSINRAKLAQRKAELERRQTELDRREKSLDSKYLNVNGAPQKMGVLDRLTRHLGVRKKVDTL